jgi:hypothetical protein
MQTAYTVIVEWDSYTLQEKVEKKMAKLWECQGGVSMSRDSDNCVLFAQAMVRKYPEQKEKDS